MSVSAARLFLGGGVVISLFFFCMGCILKICVLRKKRRCTQKLQGRIASIEGFRTSNMPMVLIEFFSTMCDRTGGNADFTFFHDFYTKIGEYKEKKFVKYEGLYRIF